MKLIILDIFTDANTQAMVLLIYKPGYSKITLNLPLHQRATLNTDMLLKLFLNVQTVAFRIFYAWTYLAPIELKIQIQANLDLAINELPLLLCAMC